MQAAMMSVPLPRGKGAKRTPRRLSPAHDPPRSPYPAIPRHPIEPRCLTQSDFPFKKKINDTHIDVEAVLLSEFV